MQPTFPHVVIPGHQIEPPQHLPTPPKPTAQEAFDIGKKLGEFEGKYKNVETSVGRSMSTMRNELTTFEASMKSHFQEIQQIQQCFIDHRKNVADALNKHSDFLTKQVHDFSEMQKKHNEQFRASYVAHNDHMLRCHEIAEDIKKEYRELMLYLDTITGYQDEWVNRVQALEGKIASREDYLKKLIIRVQAIEKFLNEIGAEIPMTPIINPMYDPNVDPVSGQIRREEPDYVKKFKELVEKRNAKREQLKQFE